MLLRAKFLSKSPDADTTGYWCRFMPGGRTTLGGVEFVFHRDCRDYDWLVVYDDMPSVRGERHTLWEEVLGCARENTLYITIEPSTIKAYGSAFLAQFGHVLTSQEPWAIRHPGRVYSQCGLVWFYGKTYEEVAAGFPVDKPEAFSTVCSSKRQPHTLHALRYEFTRRLHEVIPELQVFGHGHRPIASKAEALDPFRCHLAIENHRALHHWTEKLADPFLAGCLPIYDGCPNVFDYFPEESLVPIDMTDFEGSVEAVRGAMAAGVYAARLPAIREARRLVLEEYSTFPMLAKLLPRLHREVAKAPGTECILSRHAWRRRHPVAAVGYGVERLVTRWRAGQAKQASLQRRTPISP